LLARGRRDLERLFPGFEQGWLAAGAHEIDFGCDFATLRGASWAVREESGIRTLFASRTLLETIVRDLLRALPRIELVERTAVTGLIAEREGRARVRAVRLADGELPAELVVDATGRGSKAPDWLGTLGVEPPAETLGDAVCAFNPVYGQGMTTAAGAAILLAETLDRVGPTSAALPRTFFRAQARFLGDAWSLATGADFRFPGTTGARPALIGVFNRYLDALFNAAAD